MGEIQIIVDLTIIRFEDCRKKERQKEKGMMIKFMYIGTMTMKSWERQGENPLAFHTSEYMKQCSALATLL